MEYNVWAFPGRMLAGDDGREYVPVTAAIVNVCAAIGVCVVFCCIPSIIGYYLEKRHAGDASAAAREYRDELAQARTGTSDEAEARYERESTAWDKDALRSDQQDKVKRLIKAVVQVLKSLVALAGREFQLLVDAILLTFATFGAAAIEQLLYAYNTALSAIVGVLSSPLEYLGRWISDLLGYVDYTRLIAYFSHGMKCTALGDAIGMSVIIVVVQFVLPWIMRQDYLLRSENYATRLEADTSEGAMVGEEGRAGMVRNMRNE